MAEPLSTSAFQTVVAAAVVSAPAYAADIVSQVGNALPVDSPKQALLIQAAGNPQVILGKTIVTSLIVSPGSARYKGQAGDEGSKSDRLKNWRKWWSPCLCYF